MVDNFPEIQSLPPLFFIGLIQHSGGAIDRAKNRFILFPLAVNELLSIDTPLEHQRRLEQYLRSDISGVINRRRSRTTIREIAKSYLYRDVLEYQTVRSPELLHKLLQALALQVGAEVLIRNWAAY